MPKNRIRQLSRRGTRSEKSPLPGLARRTPRTTACHDCGALFVRKTWRRDHKVKASAYDGVIWRTCPACRQVEQGAAYGKVVLQGAWATANQEQIRRRIENVAARAEFTQPQRRIVSFERVGRGLEVLTTSQKLAHRVARELEKAFGGRASYAWSSSDRTLRAVWSHDVGGARKRGAASARR
jgi:NMD protein affecting ribosome stability and mRNA decay